MVSSHDTKKENFNPRPPRGERQGYDLASAIARLISIHALREESDAVRIACARFCCKFQSTPSARRATYCKIYNEWFRDISIHALREESDRGKKRREHRL